MPQAQFPGTGHDHDVCRNQALTQAEEILARTGGRLTRDRKAVLDALLDSHQAQGAYELMDRIDWHGRRPAPAVIYRALDFLVSHGLAHKIESLNAFMACPQAGSPHKPMIMICTSCSQVAEFEAPAIGRAITRSAKESGFIAHSTTVEVSGLCETCAREQTS